MSMIDETLALRAKLDEEKVDVTRVAEIHDNGHNSTSAGAKEFSLKLA